MYFVIEICDRELPCVYPVKDLKAAVDKANELLESHCAVINRPDLYTVKNGLKPDQEWPPEAQAADMHSSQPSAWCNAASMKWDAHVTSMSPEGAAQALGLLLKEACKARTEKPGSDCGDEKCDDCPVNGVLGMLKEVSDDHA